MERMDNWLREIGRRVRSLRAQRGVSRKHLSTHSQISERYLAQVESGQANLSFAMLYKISRALDVELLTLVDLNLHGPIDAQLRALVNNLEESQKQQLVEHIEHVIAPTRRQTDQRVALIGMRGAGKTSAGTIACEMLGAPFFRVSDRISELAGMSLAEIMDLGGQNAYRRWEQTALQDIIENNSRCVIETGGSVVAESRTFNMLREHCKLVWVQAQPEQHMNRVMAQGDMRPFEHHQQTLDDLTHMLHERESLYATADYKLDTSVIDMKTAGKKLFDLIKDDMQ